MKIKVLHIVGGSLTNGAAKGANILHQALSKLNKIYFIQSNSSTMYKYILTLGVVLVVLLFI